MSEIGNSNFNGLVLKKPGVCMVMIHRPSCGYCTEAKPDFLIFGNKVANNRKFQTFLLDSSQHTVSSTILDAVGSTGVPTYVLFENGHLYGHYRPDADRSEKGLMAFYNSLEF